MESSPRFSRSPVLLFIFLPLSIFPLFGPQRTSVTLGWDPSPDKHVISYRLYYADVTRRKRLRRSHSTSGGRRTRRFQTWLPATPTISSYGLLTRRAGRASRRI